MALGIPTYVETDELELVVVCEVCFSNTPQVDGTICTYCLLNAPDDGERPDQDFGSELP